jgi:hypothetical protein
VPGEQLPQEPNERATVKGDHDEEI